MFDDELESLQDDPRDSQIATLETQLRAEQEMSLLLTESMADLELALEDRGWYQLQGVAQTEFSRAGLGRAADIARTFAVINPLIKRGLGLRAAYIWGAGVSIRARSVGEDNSQDVNAVIQAFIDDESNKTTLTSAPAQRRLEHTVGTDGNVFLANFTNPRTGRVQARSVPFREIQDIITNPDDVADPWYYLREWQTTAQIDNAGSATTVNQTRRAYYPALGYQPLKKLPTIDRIPVQWDAPILHVKVNDLDGWRWGIGDAYAALQYARAYDDFLKDWAKLVRALSRFAWRLSGDKSSKAQSAAAKLRTIANAAPLTALDPAFQSDSMSGATATMGPGATLEAIPKTGATIDSGSGRPLAAMTAAALAVPVTMMLADPGVTGARAVAETLDKPTELEMVGRQSLWTAAQMAEYNYVIDQAVIAPEGPLKGTVTRDGNKLVVTLAGDADRTIDIVWPDMSGMQTLQLVQAIVAADSTGKMPPRETMRLLLEALGVDDVDDLLKDYTDETTGEFISPGAKDAASAGQAAVEEWRRGGDPAALLS